MVWGSTTLTVSFAQLPPAGDWALGLSFFWIDYLVCCLLAYLKKTDTTRRPPDYFFLITALSALPLWYLAQDPLVTVLVLIFADGLGFGPTIRKSYSLAYSEGLLFFVIMAVRYFRFRRSLVDVSSFPSCDFTYALPFYPNSFVTTFAAG